MASRPEQQTRSDKAASAARAGKAGKDAAKLSIVGGGNDTEAAADTASAKAATAPPKQPRKQKRTLTPGNLYRTVANVVTSAPTLVRALVKPRTSRALREKVVLGVTSINDCRYCAWGHTHWALSHGVPLDEVNQILGHQTAKLLAKDPAEAAAILFAQHYAEHRDQFDPESIEHLRTHYSEQQIREIMAYIHAITLGNLTGNTFDAFLGRFRSHGHTSVFFEGAVATVVAPIAAVVLLVSKFDRKVGIRKLRAR